MVGDTEVAMEPIDQLTGRRDDLLARSQTDDTQAQQLLADAAAKYRDAGAFLVGQPSAWNATAVAIQMADVDELTRAIDQIDQELAELKGVSRQGLAGFFKRFGDRQRLSALGKRRDDLTSKVEVSLQALARAVLPPTIPEADALLESARSAEVQSISMREQSVQLQSAAQSLTQQVDQRNAGIRNMGFDALWTAAWLQTNEPPAIQSPLVLRHGEIAWLSAASRLSRQATRTHWEGSGQGFSFPIGHTGIRYRVGSFRGRPIQTSVIKAVDAGTLVLTNQRLAFVGSAKSVIVSLPHVVHVECYSDALAVFQDKRETPDFFHLDSPKYVLFYLNYALDRLQ